MLGGTPVDALKSYLERWAETHHCCEPADRQVAESGIHLAYQAAGYMPPERIIWCGGPLEIAEHLANASSHDVIGANVKYEVFDQVRSRVGAFAEIIWKEVVIAAAELGGRDIIGGAIDEYDRCKAISGSIDDVVRRAADISLARIGIRASHTVLRLRGQHRLLPRAGFNEVAIGAHEFASLGVYEYLHDVMGWHQPTQSMRGLWKIARSAGWVVPHAHVCWVSERPERILTDARGRLHCANGPALRYRDGWSLHAWKGVPVPAWAIMQPELIAPSTLADTWEPVLRNCMIEIMTPERFLSIGAPHVISKDATGTLWHKAWLHRGVTVGSWTAVEVINGTAESDGSLKHYFLRVPSRIRTAREAVAWTYGLTAEQYDSLQLRT